MAYSYEGVSTHPKLKRQPCLSYTDKYGPPCTSKDHEEGLKKAFGLIKNREPLAISSSGQWSIDDIMSLLENEK